MATRLLTIAEFGEHDIKRDKYLWFSRVYQDPLAHWKERYSILGWDGFNWIQPRQRRFSEKRHAIKVARRLAKLVEERYSARASAFKDGKRNIPKLPPPPAEEYRMVIWPDIGSED